MIETLLSLALMGLLMGVALPSFEITWLQSRRQDAHNSLLQLHLKQLQYRGLHAQYASSLADLGWPSSSSAMGHYVLSLDQVSAQTYALHAHVTGLQSRDMACSTMSLQVTENARVQKTSSSDHSASPDQNEPGHCWPW